MGKILANDGLSGSGIEKLTKYGFQVITDKVPQEELIEYINTNGVDVLLVRSATKVRKDIIDSCPSLKIIGRGGVGMDNIDVEYAREKGLKVINTPAASSESVAELVFAHLYSGMRFLYESNRQMPVKGNTDFEKMKKAFGGGAELRGKTIGIIGMGRIGVEVARIALGLRMKVIAADTFVGKANIEVDFYNGQSINVDIITEPIDEILKQADIITLHVPAQKDFVIGKEELAIMKDGVVLINCARGGVIDEEALIEALDSDKVRFAGLDVFENEPTPSEKILTHSKISLSPHIGAATLEAQDRIGTELADQIFQILS
ncbi:3-phosphoglycerate dehydrogenase [Elizabethkingia meningoseptica]|uniref:D-2-hydroxyacid dehydrogenase n=1 Tax=Elizabethkingia meningoseptica TaxID=238 RepID=UPI000332D044|nr:D-2-hydroxyacid dehydrogenase [Elizabethkingia meningoseptica]AQX05999.1 3-phosphoglycerate dehydrogenase [Elizabethkingia meningoseptica]AQX48045.1 3-phosphoglycerate dehydrogenase [Elizabethkingia meningoseptica]EOR30971.1 Phosphoglycerate dehydrogenase [Elizabethkingia meningoseptica ATCC 13253 = NBRC 12535]KUY23233.1 3-phosphoglycerate dehydrogenase [Elizabethkingia meningoseptica]MDE5487533.1 D-2-hydroxyacid dehydrogenase [Elizabethkingia meningoseptica]